MGEQIAIEEQKKERAEQEQRLQRKMSGIKPTALITYGMGPRALRIFQAAGGAVLRTSAATFRDVVVAYNDDTLEEMTEGCHHARHA